MSECLHTNMPNDIDSVPIVIQHPDPASKKSIKLFLQGPQGAPVVKFIEPGESLSFNLADCFEAHIVEWSATPKAAPQNTETDAAPGTEG